jgi:hypothetical protein
MTRDKWKPGQVRYLVESRSTFEVTEHNQGTGWWCRCVDNEQWFIMQDYWPTDLLEDVP